jgi:hypothetical protein
MNGSNEAPFRRDKHAEGWPPGLGGSGDNEPADAPGGLSASPIPPS